MSGAVIMAEDPTEVQPGSQVTVVTGTDFTVNPPPAATDHDVGRGCDHSDDRGGVEQYGIDGVGDDGQLGGVPGADPDGQAVGTLGPAVVHAERGRRYLRGAPSWLPAGRRITASTKI